MAGTRSDGCRTPARPTRTERATERTGEETDMTAGDTTRGREHIAELQAKFPAIPRAIVIKTDVLREGVQPGELLTRIGPHSFPHFLVWNTDHPWNPMLAGGKSELRAIPWNFILDDGHTPVVCRLDPVSPYEVRLTEAQGFVLYRDGEI